MIICNKIFDEIEIGDTETLSHVLTKKDIQLFAIMSGDINPAHLDEEYASSDIFKKIIAHGMWGGALISTILGTKLPGPGTIYLSQTLQFLRPVVVGDEVTITVRVLEKKPEKNIIKLSCVCTNQHGKEIIVGQAEVIAPTEKVERLAVHLPRVEFVENRGNRYYAALIEHSQSFPPLKTAIVHPVDEHSLRGAIEAAQENIIIPVLVGPRHKIEKMAQGLQLDIFKYELYDAPHSHAAAEKAAYLAQEGQVQCLMKGKLQTSEMMTPILMHLKTERRITHVAVLVMETYHKPLFITDVAINIFPTLADKKDIVQNAIDLFHVLKGKIPKVAIISAIEMVNEKLPATIDAAALCKMAERGQITGGILDGPLAFDNAISKEAARMKDICSSVAGDADILVVPTLESGNLLYKQMLFLSQVTSAGIVLGAKVPIVLTSRADNSELSLKASCAVAKIFYNKKIDEGDIQNLS